MRIVKMKKNLKESLTLSASRESLHPGSKTERVISSSPSSKTYFKGVANILVAPAGVTGFNPMTQDASNPKDIFSVSLRNPPKNFKHNLHYRGKTMQQLNENEDAEGQYCWYEGMVSPSKKQNQSPANSSKDFLPIITPQRRRSSTLKVAPGGQW